MKHIAIFVSGNGTNCENIIHHFQTSEVARVVLVVSNRPDAFALTRAKRLDVPTALLPKDDFQDETKVMSLLNAHKVDFIVLAGFLLMIPSFLIHTYQHRMVNIHPSLLPKFGGKGMYGHHVHEAVKAAGETETGITIHWVSEACDGGEVIAQFHTPLTPSDTPDDIAAKVHTLEMKHFPIIIENCLNQPSNN